MIAPQSVQVGPEIIRLVAEIEEFKGAWNVMGRLTPERLSALKRIATIESIASSTRLEGATLTDREVEALLSNRQATSFASRDQREVAGYAAVLELVFSSWSAMPLTENHIRQLHRDLLRHSDQDARYRGRYRTVPNGIAAFDTEGQRLDVPFETAPPFEIPRRMTELTAWLTDAQGGGQLHPPLRIGLWLGMFLAIHPFQDGNGRVSRVLAALLLLQAGYSYVPYSSLERVVEHHKDAYNLVVRRTQRAAWSDTPDWQPWLHFFLKALAEQTRRLGQRLEQEQRLDSLPTMSLQIVDVLEARRRATMGEIITLTGGKRDTIKSHLRTLVEQARLLRHGRGRGVWYQLP
ncbi:MAG: Fic family protein [Gemmatimonadales bacterium]|nr:Fic family protein [Gemmatimonadales bacterium]